MATRPYPSFLIVGMMKAATSLNYSGRGVNLAVSVD